MTRYQILFVIAVALLGYNLGRLVAANQISEAIKGWQDALNENNRLIDMVKTTTANLEKTANNLDQQNRLVSHLLAEKRARSGVTVPEMDP